MDVPCQQRLADAAARAFERKYTAGDAASAVFEHGFALLSADKTNISDQALKQLYHDVDQYVPWNEQLREGSSLRYTLNDYEWIRNNPNFRNIIIDSMRGIVGDCLKHIARRQDPHCRLFFDIAGGDTVRPNGPGQRLHSDDRDWQYGPSWMGHLCISIFLEEQEEEAAPLWIVPMCGSARSEYVPEYFARPVMGKRGDVLIRDVTVMHCGSANLSNRVRHLPGFRVFLHSRICESDWRPMRTVEDALFGSIFAEDMHDFFTYIWRQDDQDLDAEQ